MKEHPHMMASGESVQVKLRFNKVAVGHIFEWFGKDIYLTDESEETFTTFIRVNENAMLFWALQYGLHVEVLEPQSLREKIGDTVVLIGEKYNRII
jgi:predicted DNA-binding transcriptional regulator YafY